MSTATNTEAKAKEDIENISKEVDASAAQATKSEIVYES